MKNLRTEDIIISLLILLAVFLVLLFPLLYFKNTHRDLDCDSFETQEVAQHVFEMQEKDVHFLDSNFNGVACEHLI